MDECLPPARDLLFPSVSKSVKGGKGLLTIGSSFRDKWNILGVLGRGGYGEIYYAMDKKSNDHVALKIECQNRRGRIAKRTILEQKVLLRLQGRAHCPKLLASGTQGTLNFLALQVLSLNLADLRKMMPSKTFSQKTVCRVAIQGVAALFDLHSVGYVHRDVKPPNMCFGIDGDTRHVLFLLDFGLVRRFLRTDGSLRTQRVKAGFRGTFRYVSNRVHSRMEQCPADDLISLLYSLMELSLGRLPWRNISGAAIVSAKDSFEKSMFASVAEKMGEPMVAFACKVSSLVPWAAVDYRQLQKTLEGGCEGVGLADPYDWDSLLP